MPLFAMEKSPAVEAARQFLSAVWDSEPPTDEALLFALDRLIEAFHHTPEVGPSETDLEAPRVGGPALYKEVEGRFRAYGMYPVSDQTAPIEDAAMMGNAIDDLADLTLDMREVSGWPITSDWTTRIGPFASTTFTGDGTLANWRFTCTLGSSAECPRWVESRR